MMLNNLENFLQETKYCDVTHPLIQKTAYNLTKGISDTRYKSKILFDYVRDNVRYQFGQWGKKASKVLQEGKGMCTNSANLFVALLRANNIPAGYGIMRVKGQEYLSSLTPPMFKSQISPESVHIYSYAFLNGKWVKADPSIDKDFSQQVANFDSTFRLAQWDGTSDQILDIEPTAILRDEGPLANIDAQLDKKPRHAKGLSLKMGNLYLQFLRESGSRFTNESILSLQEYFLLWLKKRYPFYYILLMSSPKFKTKHNV